DPVGAAPDRARPRDALSGAARRAAARQTVRGPQSLPRAAGGRAGAGWRSGRPEGGHGSPAAGPARLRAERLRPGGDLAGAEPRLLLPATDAPPRAARCGPDRVV